MQEIKGIVAQEGLPLDGMTPVDTKKALTMDSIEELRYFMMCFNESLRLEAPTVTSGGIFTETVQLEQYTIKKGDMIVINLQAIHTNPDQWQQPRSFLPERFDPKSSLYLKPNGEKRHPFAFGPFIGGKRICVGKTFAEIVAKFVIPALLSRLRFEFVDPKTNMGNKIQYNLDIDEEPVIMMKVSKVLLKA